MNPQDPLANLQPLREPELIGWWPPAPGWWVLLVLTLLILTVLVYLLVRHYRRNAYRRRAMLQLEALRAQHAHDKNNGAYVGAVNSLLKSVALTAFDQRAVAAVHGEQWETFLQQQVKQGALFPPGFSSATYRKTATPVDPDALHLAAVHWIKRHRVAS